MSSAARDLDVPIRIGVNAGSLEKDLQKKYGEPNADALVESALRHVEILDRFSFDNYKMSLKASNIKMTVDAYRKMSNIMGEPSKTYVETLEATLAVPGRFYFFQFRKIAFLVLTCQISAFRHSRSQLT